MRRVYEREAQGWMASAGAVDRDAWSPGYDLFAESAKPGGTILDLGCGPGYDAPGLKLRGFKLVGFDAVRSFLEANPQAYDGRVVQGDLRALPFAPESFDGVWADGVLHHVPKADIDRLLRRVRALLRPWGVLAVSVERGMGERFAPPEGGILEPRFYAYYEPEELQTRLESAGFEPVGLIVGGESARSHGFVMATALRLG